MALRGEYLEASYSNDVKAVLGAVGHQLRAEGRSVREVAQLFFEAGYALGDETVRRWTNAAGSDEPIISPNKKTGAKKKLDDEKRKVAAGWVLQEKKKSTADATVGL
jgi:transposase